MPARKIPLRPTALLALLVFAGALSSATVFAEERIITGTIDTVGGGRITVMTNAEVITVVIIATTRGTVAGLRAGDRVTVRYIAADVNVATDIQRSN